MTREIFYHGKTIASVDWWIHEPDLPENLVWGRRRVFTDGTADACFEGGSTLYGFENADYAGYILAEDEYARFPVDSDDDHASAREWTSVTTPTWLDSIFPSFEYFGSY